MIELGTLEKVDPRTIWNHEAHDFTPWLADNLDRLGSAIGIELELLEREANVGDFSLDLLARDLGRNANVIIENQLATTDHDHLGKLITYASGYDAQVVLWVSTDIREEHRQALDWLNQRTDSTTEFFAVIVEVIKIGESNPALQFRVVVSPNEWRKSARIKTTAGTSEKSEKYRTYFQTLIDDLRETHRFTGAKKAQPQNWYSFSSGNKKFVYSHSFGARNRIRAEVYIDTGDADENKMFFDSLQKDREAIESQFGQQLEWERLDDKRASRIAVYRKGSIEDSSEELQAIHEWTVRQLLKLKEVFGPRAYSECVNPSDEFGGI
ncbi:hypothetical protein EC9_03710 [Rosistilla ulvae]|uniref:DUF4268 domain-containing protein n=1 Tax=Rosistilla ulvae TaxID=1930277 RepID=A0A517LUB4_9BACT|nr:DUF4268 domain-containing protein [Rosistilla ulvae]QDS86211.1 hypothetical protein EC9_03710 [Rosistilla ulvae]